MRALLPLLGLLATAAAPGGNSFSTAQPMPDLSLHSQPAPTTAPPGFTAAPTPNQDASGPRVRASPDSSVAPGFFSRRDQYRGEGISPNSSAQIGQDRRVKPGAGISLTMPLH